MAAERQTVYRVEIEDRPGALNELLESTADTGANIVFMAAFSSGQGRGDAYLVPDKPDALKEMVRSLKLTVNEYAGFLLSGADAVGVGAEVTKPLADEGINIVLSAAMASGGTYQLLILVDPMYADAAAKAIGA